jgi:proteasome lid subunit RPN8/RPN11
MTVKISSLARETMELAAKADHLHEVCGLLLGSAGQIDTALQIRNVAKDTRVNFELEPAPLFTALRAERLGGPAVVGYFHSHPNGLARPSPTDQAMAAPDNRVWIIIGTELTAWRSTVAGFIQIGIN